MNETWEKRRNTFIFIALMFVLTSYMSVGSDILSVAGLFPVKIYAFPMMAIAAGMCFNIFSDKKRPGFWLFLVRISGAFLVPYVICSLLFKVAEFILFKVLKTEIGRGKAGFGDDLGLLVVIFIVFVILYFLMAFIKRIYIVCPLTFVLGIGFFAFVSHRGWEMTGYRLLLMKVALALPMVTFGCLVNYLAVNSGKGKNTKFGNNKGDNNRNKTVNNNKQDKNGKNCNGNSSSKNTRNTGNYSNCKRKKDAVACIIILAAAGMKILLNAIFKKHEKNILISGTIGEKAILLYLAAALLVAVFWWYIARFVARVCSFKYTFKFKRYIYCFMLSFFWGTSALIGNFATALGDKRFRAENFKQDVYYSFLPSWGFKIFYTLGTFLLLFAFSFVLNIIISCLKKTIIFLYNKAGFHPEKYTSKDVGRFLLRMGAVVFFACGVTLTATVIWLFDTWPKLDIHELIFTINSPLDGTSSEIVVPALVKYALPATVVIILSAGFMIGFRKRKKTMRILTAMYFVLGGILLFLSFRHADKRLGLVEYIKNANGDDSFIKDNYVNSGDVKLTFPEKKRNLIYIYLESMEVTFADEASGGAFKKNVIPNLTKLAEEGEDFGPKDKKLNGGFSLEGTTWTIGAVFGDSSGVPMLINMSSNAFKTQGAFCKNIIMLGDILKDNGYNNVCMLGASASFGGVDTFFKTHGDYDIYDYDRAISEGWIPSDYYKWWGFEDEKLFGYAKDKLTELGESGEPFNFTLMTMDTHFEDGYVCDKCENTFGDDRYSNVIHCSDEQVYEFIEWIKSQDWYENTTIVMSGDHPTMDTDYCENVDSDYLRRVYTNFYNSTEVYKGEGREYTTLDIYPTTLAAMGVKISGDRLAWGTNLYSNLPTLMESYGKDVLNDNFEKGRKFLSKLANFEMNDMLLKNASADAYIKEVDKNYKYVTLGVVNPIIHPAMVDKCVIEIHSGDAVKNVILSKSGNSSTDYYYFEMSNSKVEKIDWADIYVDIQGERYLLKHIEDFNDYLKEMNEKER